MNSLKTVSLSGTELNKQVLNGFKQLQTTIETIELDSCVIRDAYVGQFFAHCPNLKYLRIKDINFESARAVVGLSQRNYPKLEHFKFVRCEKLFRLNEFLDVNRSLKELRITDTALIMQPLHATKVQVDYLFVEVNNMNDTHDLLTRFRTLTGLFKKLRIQIKYFDYGAFNYELFMDEIVQFCTLDALYTNRICTWAQDHLTELRELHLYACDVGGKKLQTFAMKLVNLERLYFVGTIGQLSESFLQHSKKLKSIIFIDAKTPGNALNLVELNRLREQAGMKRKIHFGVDEAQYLATKWNETGEMYDFIEITRKQTLRKHYLHDDEIHSTFE